MSNNTESKLLPVPIFEATAVIQKNTFPDFAVVAREWLLGVNYLLRADEDFEQAAADAKKAKEVEDLITATKAKAVEEAEELNNAFLAMDTLSGEMRDARLKLSKLIDTQKETIKESIITGALTQCKCDPALQRTYRATMEAAIKGKKSFATMRESVRIALATVNDKIARCKTLIEKFEAANGGKMTTDKRDLEVMDPVSLEAELRRRLEAAQAIEREATLKAEADAQRKAADAARLALVEANKPPAPPPAIYLSAKDDAPWLPDPDDRPPVPNVYIAGAGSLRPMTATEEPAESTPEPDGIAELAAFLKVVVAAFLAVKDARKVLLYPANQAIAADLAEMGNIWYDANLPKTIRP
jgi:hypothetical protein